MIIARLRGSILQIVVVSVLTLGVGLSFIGSVGPLTLPDPMMHCCEIYALISGQSFSSASQWDDGKGNQYMVQWMTIDKRIGELEGHNATITKIITLPRSSDQNRSEQIQHLTGPYDGDVNGIRRRSQYFPFVYAPQAAAVAVTQCLGGSPWAALQAARMVNLLLALFIEVIAIVILPRGKWTYVAVIVMPISIFSASSISIDALVLPFSLLLVALAMRSLDIGKMSNISMVICTALVIALLFWKTAYASLALILLALPNSVVSWKRKVVSAAIAVVAFAAIYIWWMTVTGINYTPSNQDLSANKEWIAAHGLEVMASFIISYVTLPFYLTNYGLNYFVPVAAAFALSILPSRGIARQVGSVKTLRSFISTWRFPIVGAIAAFLAVFAIFVTLAIGWTRFSAEGWASGLFGMQERYFVPLFPLIVLLLYPVVDKVSLGHRQGGE